jgi:beta-glucosidase
MGFRGWKTSAVAALAIASPVFASVSQDPKYLGVRDDLHFSIHARGSNKDGSTPVYKDPTADIEDRINDLLPRMTVQEKVAQL